MERTDWQSDKALEREAITHKTQHMTANTVYELHHTDSYKNHTHQEKLDERQFLACCPLQQTKENVSHVKITKETRKADRK